MQERLKEHAKAMGFGTVKKILHAATILHADWEMDNKAWIVEMADGSVVALTTSHGGLCRWTREEAEENLAETEKSATSIREALAMWPNAPHEGPARDSCAGPLDAVVGGLLLGDTDGQ